MDNITNILKDTAFLFSRRGIYNLMQKYDKTGSIKDGRCVVLCFLPISLELKFIIMVVCQCQFTYSAIENSRNSVVAV